MTESIGQKLVSTIGDIVPTYFAEAETDEYPYAVYDQVVSPSRTKDGAYKFTSQLTLAIVSDKFTEAEDIRDSVISAIDTQMRGSVYNAGLDSMDTECQEGIWIMYLYYTITQHQ